MISREQQSDEDLATRLSNFIDHNQGDVNHNQELVSLLEVYDKLDIPTEGPSPDFTRHLEQSLAAKARQKFVGEPTNVSWKYGSILGSAIAIILVVMLASICLVPSRITLSKNYEFMSISNSYMDHSLNTNIQVITQTMYVIDDSNNSSSEYTPTRWDRSTDTFIDHITTKKVNLELSSEDIVYSTSELQNMIISQPGFVQSKNLIVTNRNQQRGEMLVYISLSEVPRTLSQIKKSNSVIVSQDMEDNIDLPIDTRISELNTRLIQLNSDRKSLLMSLDDFDKEENNIYSIYERYEDTSYEIDRIALEKEIIQNFGSLALINIKLVPQKSGVILHTDELANNWHDSHKLRYSYIDIVSIMMVFVIILLFPRLTIILLVLVNTRKMNIMYISNTLLHKVRKSPILLF